MSDLQYQLQCVRNAYEWRSRDALEQALSAIEKMVPTQPPSIESLVFARTQAQANPVKESHDTHRHE